MVVIIEKDSYKLLKGFLKKILIPIQNINKIIDFYSEWTYFFYFS